MALGIVFPFNLNICDNHPSLSPYNVVFWFQEQDKALGSNIETGEGRKSFLLDNKIFRSPKSERKQSCLNRFCPRL